MKLTIWLNHLVKRKLGRLPDVGLAGIVSCLLISLASNAQSTSLTLQQVQELARGNYPLIKQKKLLAQTTELNIANLSKGYLPQFAVYGQASYQSDVTQVDVQGAPIKIEAPAKDQYKMYAEATQLLYDGGQINAQKRIQEQTRRADDQQVEVELYKVKQRVNNIFLSILFLDAQLQQISLIREDINTGIKRTEAQIQNGVSFRSNLYLLQAELLKTDQRKIELEGTRVGLINTLAVFINKPLSGEVRFISPSSPVPASPASAAPAPASAASPSASAASASAASTSASAASASPVPASQASASQASASQVSASPVPATNSTPANIVDSNKSLQEAQNKTGSGENFSYYSDISRPEIRQFNSRSTLLGLQEDLIRSRNRPKTNLFLQGGYGRPALNMLENQFEWYYVGGVRLSWNLGGMYTAKKEKQLVQISQSNLKLQEESFVLNTRAEMASQLSEITKLEKLVATDDEIIRLRNQVRDAAKAQLENGVITANDYVREINAADQAVQAKITHEIQLLQAKISYGTTSGKL